MKKIDSNYVVEATSPEQAERIAAIFEKMGYNIEGYYWEAAYKGVSDYYFIGEDFRFKQGKLIRPHRVDQLSKFTPTRTVLSFEKFMEMTMGSPKSDNLNLTSDQVKETIKKFPETKQYFQSLFPGECFDEDEYYEFNHGEDIIESDVCWIGALSVEREDANKCIVVAEDYTPEIYPHPLCQNKYIIKFKKIKK